MTDLRYNKLSTEEAAAYLGYAPITLEVWRSKDTGPVYYKPSHKVFYYKKDLDAWIAGSVNDPRAD
mgnify:CR=1 FL=1